jgi:hypothetical protein
MLGVPFVMEMLAAELWRCAGGGGGRRSSASRAWSGSSATSWWLIDWRRGLSLKGTFLTGDVLYLLKFAVVLGSVGWTLGGMLLGLDHLWEDGLGSDDIVLSSSSQGCRTG